MKKEAEEQPVTAPEEKIIELVVTEEDYAEGLKRGWTDDDMLKPGRYRLRRGGFWKRHAGLRGEDKKTA